MWKYEQWALSKCGVDGHLFECDWMAIYWAIRKEARPIFEALKRKQAVENGRIWECGAARCDIPLRVWNRICPKAQASRKLLTTPYRHYFKSTYATKTFFSSLQGAIPTAHVTKYEKQIVSFQRKPQKQVSLLIQDKNGFETLRLALAMREQIPQWPCIMAHLVA